MRAREREYVQIHAAQGTNGLKKEKKRKEKKRKEKKRNRHAPVHAFDFALIYPPHFQPSYEHT